MSGDGEALERIATTSRGFAADLVAPCARGFAAMAKGDWSAAATALQTAMTDHARLGGSRAQRDLLELSLCHALLRCGNSTEATRRLGKHRPMLEGAGLYGEKSR